MVRQIRCLIDHLVNKTGTEVFERNIEVELPHFLDALHEPTTLFLEIMAVGSAIRGFDLGLMAMFSGVQRILVRRSHHACAPDGPNEALQLRNVEMWNNAPFASPPTRKDNAGLIVVNFMECFFHGVEMVLVKHKSLGLKNKLDESVYSAQHIVWDCTGNHRDNDFLDIPMFFASYLFQF
jgi:hypothetical protein